MGKRKREGGRLTWGIWCEDGLPSSDGGGTVGFAGEDQEFHLGH